LRSIGGGAGWAGDRIEPAVDLITLGGVDDVVLECLAERTLVSGLRTRRAGGTAAWDPRLRARLTPLLPVAHDRGCRIVTNLGGADPQGAARAIRDLARELGLPRLRVAAVCGDDVLDRADAIAWTETPGDGEWLGAHAYLGSDGITAALADGAEVVVCGRAADSALFLGALRGALDDDPDARAGALAVGHLLECGGQLTGGNHQAPGGARLTPHQLAELGYPLARVQPDGSAELAVTPGRPGTLDRLTCTLQLLYEVHDPSAYITPDGVVDLGGVRFEERPGGTVGVSGARLGALPRQLKVSGFLARPGVIADCEIGFAGDGALERARDAAALLALRLQRAGVPDARIDLVGVDSLLGAASSPLSAAPPELRVHVSAPCSDADAARAVEDEVIGLTIAGPAHAGGVRSERRPHVAVLDGRIDRHRVREEVVWA
jgi:hypothetical protein